VFRDEPRILATLAGTVQKNDQRPLTRRISRVIRGQVQQVAVADLAGDRALEGLSRLRVGGVGRRGTQQGYNKEQGCFHRKKRSDQVP